MLLRRVGQDREPPEDLWSAQHASGEPSLQLGLSETQKQQESWEKHNLHSDRTQAGYMAMKG